MNFKIDLFFPLFIFIIEYLYFDFLFHLKKHDTEKYSNITSVYFENENDRIFEILNGGIFSAA